jgi:hypothetical protein
MVYINRQGAVVEKAGLLTRLVQFVQELVRLVLLFFKTIVDPNAAKLELEKRQKRQERKGGVKLGGATGSRGPGPRIAGLSDFKDAGGNCAAGA